MSAGLGSDGLGSEDFGSEDLPAAASDFFRLLLASPGFVPNLFLSSDCVISLPLAPRLVARAGGPASTDLRKVAIAPAVSRLAV